jgi:predicted nucleotidyltransferase
VTRNPDLARAKRILRQHLPKLRERYSVKWLGIFGSYVRGEQKKRSDLDVLIEFEQTPTLLEFVHLKRHLSDLVSVQKQFPIFRIRYREQDQTIWVDKIRHTQMTTLFSLNLVYNIRTFHIMTQVQYGKTPDSSLSMCGMSVAQRFTDQTTPCAYQSFG